MAQVRSFLKGLAFVAAAAGLPAIAHAQGTGDGWKLCNETSFIIETAVKGMLPKGPLGREMFRKMKVYAGPEHKHAAQQPQVLDI